VECLYTGSNVRRRFNGGRPDQEDSVEETCRSGLRSNEDGSPVARVVCRNRLKRNAHELCHAVLLRSSRVVAAISSCRGNRFLLVNCFSVLLSGLVSVHRARKKHDACQLEPNIDSASRGLSEACVVARRNPRLMTATDSSDSSAHATRPGQYNSGCCTSPARH
jgi:hypothetical protein